MYELLRKPEEKHKKSSRLWFCLVLAVLMLVSVIIPMIWSVWFRHQFYDFVSDLSNSTLYAYRHVSLNLTWQGQHKVITNSGFYGPYRVLSAAGVGKAVSRPPDSPPDVLLEYGDGSSLSLWQTDLNPQQDLERTEGLLVHYVDPAGEAFTYRTGTVTLDILYASLYP